MKKIIISLVSSLLVVLLGILGLNMFKGAGPRERIKAENGSSIIVEELSFYRHNDKIFGKIFKPADENGYFPDSLGAMPVVIFFHEPLKTSYPESIAKALAKEGLICYVSAYHEKEKDVEFIIKKISKEKFTDTERIYLISDSYSSEAVVKASCNLRKYVNGLVMIESELDDKTERMVRGMDFDVLDLAEGDISTAKAAILDYLELRGALK
jgi:hypothetical protein